MNTTNSETSYQDSNQVKSSLPSFDLSGKYALITGGTQGIGAAIAIGFGLTGAVPIIAARDSKKLEVFLKDLEALKIDAKGVLLDVTNADDIQKVIVDTEEGIGPIDILVNNAGIVLRSPVEDLTERDWDLVIKTNLTGPFLLSKYVGKYMLKRKRGKIINICSLMSEIGRDSVAAYSASKGGLKMLTKNLASEWAPHNIQVNGIGPGYIATPINESYRKEGSQLNDYILSRTPAGRWGTPYDLVGPAIFLASNASDFVNGQILYVDGGLLSSFGKPK